MRSARHHNQGLLHVTGSSRRIGVAAGAGGGPSVEPELIAAPVIAVSDGGAPDVGKTLIVVTRARWKYGPILSRAGQWYADDVEIDEATALAILVGEDQSGAAEVDYREIATNAIGASDPAVSNALGPVGPVEPAPAETINAPELTLTSGTTAPPAFTRYLDATVWEGDYIERQIDTVDTYDSGDLLEEDRVLLYDGIEDTFVPAVPISLDLQDFTIQDDLEYGGPYFIRERIRRDYGDIQVYSDWSDDETFTLIQEVGSGATVEWGSGDTHVYSYGNGPRTIDDISIDDGDKILIHLVAWFADFISEADMVFTDVSGNGGAITFAQAGSPSAVTSGSGVAVRTFAFWADTAAVTSLDMSFTTQSATRFVNANVMRIKGAAPGAPLSSVGGTGLASGFAERDVDGGLSATDPDLLVISEGHGASTGDGDFTGAEEIVGSELPAADSYIRGKSAFQIAAANVTIGLTLGSEPYGWRATKFEAA